MRYTVIGGVIMGFDFNLLDSVVQKTTFNGVVLIAKNHKSIFSKGYGYRDIFKQKPIDITTPMRIASITKTFTAVAILKLQEQGLLKTSDSVRKYIPSCKHDITIHHLLSNSSGIPNFSLEYDFSEALNSENVLKSLINITINYDLNFEPGAKFEYSVVGYLVLQYILEQITNNSYYNFLSENILLPLGMNNTYFEDPGLNIEDAARQYTLKDELVEVDFFDMRVAGAGGALISSASDLLTFNNALLNHTILSKKSVELIFGKHTFIVQDNYYGYGMIVTQHNDYSIMRRRNYHSGGGFGVRSFNTLYPDDDLQVILISNTDTKEPFEEVRKSIDQFLFL